MADSTGTTLGDAPAYDAFFRTLVRATDRRGISLPVVINLKGTLITGQLISGRAYFSELGELFAGGAEMAFRESNGETADPAVWRDIFQNYADLYPEHVTDESELETDDEASSDHDPGFFHLRDAKIVSGPIVVPTEENNSFLWRGKIASVDGFAFGGSPENLE